MFRFIVIFTACIISTVGFSQKAVLDNYSYVVVPDKFEFSSGTDQYQLNSMSVFYLEKSGFNAFLASTVPNVNRCEGLYANVEEVKMFFGTKLEVVLNDCNGKEVYRSREGKSKYKEYDKAYQDALRKAFKSIEDLRVRQKDMVLLTDANEANSVNVASAPVSRITEENGLFLPNGKYMNYSFAGKSFLLRKTAEGFSLYQEDASAADGLVLIGKITIIDKSIRYLDNQGQTYDAQFDAQGNLTITKDDASSTYKLIN